MSIPTPDTLLDLSGKVALVTGASSGLGAGIAKRLAQAGASIAIADLQPADEICSEIRGLGQECFSAIVDVINLTQVENLFEQIEEHLGPVDILINNAGIYPSTDLLDMTPEEWDRIMQVNLKSVFLTTQTAAKRMINAEMGGAIVNISSIEDTIPAVGHSHYAASKAGVVMFGKSAALELGKHNIRVNTVSPALFNRPGLAQQWPEGVARFMDNAVLKRVGEVDDIADACLFLSSEASRWITGMNLPVDGGVLISQAY